MSRNRNRNTNEKKQSTDSVKKTSNQIEGFSADQWENIIAAAILKAEEQRKKEKEQSLSEEKKEWRKQLRVKEFTGKPPFIRFFLDIIETMRLVMIIPFKKLTPLSSNAYTTGLFSLILASILIGAGTLCMFGVVLIPLSILLREGITLITLVQGLAWGMASHVFGVLFYLSGNEILYTKDRNYVFSVFSATTSVIAIILSIIAFVSK